MSDLHDDPLEKARAHAAQGHWGAAAIEFARAARVAHSRLDRNGTRQAWEAAGEAWRRDDRPLAASEAFQHALEHSPEGPMAALVRLKLAGVLGDLGESHRAKALLDASVAALPAGPLRLLALDTRFDAALALGDTGDARSLLPLMRAQLVDPPDPALAMAVTFREGQLARLDGHFDEAMRRFATVIALAEPLPEAVPALAAATAEMAEIAGFRGHTADALALWEKAGERFASVGRQGLDWRADAGRIRAAVEAGAAVFGSPLDEGIVTAVARGMPTLEADLRLARGVQRAASDRAGARDDLLRAIALAEPSGHRWRAGRARLELCRRVQADVALAERAYADLEGNAPWQARALAARAAALAPVDPAASTAESLRALARFEAMSMDADAARIRGTVEFVPPR